MKSGSCLCGAVTYTLDGVLRPSMACHCTQCRKTSGHYWSATQVPTDKFTVTKNDGLKWYRSSNTARRGFCGECGSSMFWQLDGEDTTSVATGTLDGPTGIKTEQHIFVADKGDYYDIEDGVEQVAQY
ncbi:GFA family protein [Amylibacter sp.]|nr:GFA family protein [Amylibacter sp.]